MKRIIFSVSLILALLLSLSSAALAQNGPTRTLPDFIKGLKLETGLSDLDGLTPATLGLDRSLVGVTGPQEVVVRLTLDPVLQLKVDGQGVAAQLRQLRTVKSQQNAFLRDARKVGGGIKVLGATQRVLNGVILKVDGAMLPTLAKNPAVYSIKPVRNYDYAPIETNLEYAVPYVGGTDMHNMGYTGEGVTVAIIDTGVDYNHALMGGSGDVNDYNNNNPSIIEPGTFPTAKVIGGYDFVGETWPNTDLTPDPDPLDSKPAGGHGTHVASTAAGLTGMAPDASVYALKVCSSQRNTCSGTAMLQALDWITDPNGDGMTDDHADVVNMSIGSLYGQPWDDDTSQAVELASMAGVLVVTSAGNNGDLPYVSGTPGATLSSLSTAATNNPSGSVQLADVLVDSSLVQTVGAQWQSWSHTLDEVIQAPVQYGDGAGGNRNGCASFAPGTLTGKIVLVDRGTCNFSLKISNVADGDGLIGIIGLVAPGDPFDGAFGAGDPSRIPGYMITQADSNLIKSLIADGVEMNFTPGMEESQGGTVASFSSRGPGQFPFKFPSGSTETMTNFIKPEIAAPGVITAAAYGTGTGLVTYQGTSMASPMVAGSAALVKQARPDMSGREVKALLVNNADTEVRDKVAIWGGELAPITRVGGGEVHVDRAIMAPAAAWENHTMQPSLSFGFVEAANRTRTILRTIQVKNYTNAPITYQVSYTFRYANDEAMDAVSLNIKGVDADGMVTVPANGMVLVPVELNILSTALPMWGMDSGALGSSGTTLTNFEFDGYVWFDDVNTTADDESMMHLAWHVLPRQSGNVLTPNGTQATLNSEYMGLPAGNVALTNDGSGYAFIDVFSLLGTSDNLPEGGWGMQSPIIDLKYVGVQTYPVPAGYCSSSESFVWVFNVSTWERTAHADVPAEFDVYLDTDPGRDGPEYVAYTTDIGWATTGSTDGRNVTAVVNLETGSGTIWFFTGHTTNSANYQLVMCGEQIGMTAADFFTPVGVDVYAFDNYFTGDLTDYIEGMVAAPLGERYGGIIDEYGFGDIPGGKLNPVTNLTVVDWGAVGTNPGELGLLLVTTGVRGDYSSGAPRGNENIMITVAP